MPSGSANAGIKSDALIKQAQLLVEKLGDRALVLATAESCTGGLVSALITEIPGSSNVFDRGFVTYSNEAKTEMLGVPSSLIRNFGAVSPEVARAMAEGTLKNSRAQITVSITGIAGPGGGSDEKPVGLVHFATCLIKPDESHPVCASHEMRFGDIGRAEIRSEAAHTALKLIDDLIQN